MANHHKLNIMETSNEEKKQARKLKDMSLQLISAKTHHTWLPEKYIRPPTDRPRLEDVVTVFSIPLINMKGSSSTPNRAQMIQDIRRACSHYGFFQVINHGVSDIVSKKMMEVATEFFNMPLEDRMQLYSEDPLKKTRLSTSFNVEKEHVLNWRDYLRHHCYPLDDHIHTWPSKPAHYREVASQYCKEIRSLVLKLLEAISESLGVEAEFMNKALGGHGQHMALNYYPECPNPELTFGLPPHSDPNVLTILQDNGSGLQVFKDGQWIAVNPIPNSFVVNIGDQLQVVSNDKYKSVLHRAVVNSFKPRISIPTFYCPSPDAVIEPASALLDSENPAVYKAFTYNEYYQKFWSNELQGKACLDFFRREESRTS